MTNQLPNGWLMVALDNLGYIVTGKTPSTKEPENFNGKIPFIKPTDLDKRGYIHETAETISEKGLKLVPSLPAGAIAVTCIGNLGKTGITTRVSATNQQINTVICSDKVINKYIYYFLTSMRSWLEKESSATTIAIINKSKFSLLPVKLPPLAEQKEIAARLDDLLAQVDTLKTRLDAIPNILKRFRQSVLAAAVSGKLTEEWRTNSNFIWKQVSLADVALGFSYGTSSKSSKEGKTPVLRMGNIQNGSLIWDDLVYTSDANEIKKYSLIKGDVLFNRTNSPELVGKTAIYRGEYPAIYAGYLICVRCKSALDPEFLNISLNSLDAKAYCRAVKSDGVSQSNINAKKLAAYSFCLPPIEEQKEIVRRVEELFAFADQVEQQVKAAQQRVNHLTQAILAKAFRGELTAQWREQNPDLISGENSAQALLAKIKAARLKSNAAASKAKRPKQTSLAL